MIKMIVLLALITSINLFGIVDSTKFKGGSGSGYAMGISSSNIALPVELSSFFALNHKGKIILKWQTETEVDNYGFEIQRRKVGSNFESIGFINGNGNTNSPKSYEYTDNEISLDGTYQYRLKQIDNDGEYQYSKTIDVVVDLIHSFALAQNYPNPFNPTTTINFQIPNKGLVTLKIFNVLGNELKVIVDDVLEEGNYSYTFDSTNFASGVYFYKLSMGSNTEIKKLTLLK